MEPKKEEIQNIKPFSVVAGILFLALLFYIAFALLVPKDTNPTYIYIILGIITIGIGIIIYSSIKSQNFREKVFGLLNMLFNKVGEIGDKIIRNMSESDKSDKKKIRKPISPELQQKLYERAENRCQYCGMGNVKLHIHHINGNPSNNSIDNLIVLCPNHHSIANSLNRNDLKTMVTKAYRVKTTVQKVD